MREEVGFARALRAHPRVRQKYFPQGLRVLGFRIVNCILLLSLVCYARKSLYEGP